MKRIIYILLAALPIIASCNQNEYSPESESGVPINFSARTYYENGLSTRTAYSGEFIGDTPKYERIDWVDGDLMKIWAEVDASNNTSAVYKVASHSTDTDNQKNSNAVIESSGDAILNWLSDATHTFYALYPSPNTTGVDADKVSLSGKTITATIPSTQVVTAETGTKVYKPDMNYAYMWAATQAAPGSDVVLGFKPLMTAFEFTVGALDPSGKTLSSFVLSTDSDSPFLTGDFTATINDALTDYTIAVTDGTGARAVTVDLGNVAVTQDSPATFTVFALPQNLTNLTMKFVFSDNTFKAVDLKRRASESDPYEFVPFEGGKKYRISNINIPADSDGWTYTLEEVDPGTAMARNTAAAGTETKGMYSYRTKDGVTEAVAMQFRYSPADPETGANLEQWTTGLPGWLTSLVAGEHSSEEDPDDPFTLTGTYTDIPVEDVDTLNEIEDHIDVLRATGRNNNRDENNPQDLALYDINNLTGTARSAKTANCYVVDRAGWYMFPLVYGNAIDWGKATSNGWNVGSYYTGSGDGWTNPGEGADQGKAGTYNVLRRFRNYLNNGITSPYILDDIGKGINEVEAVIVWEDVTEEDLFIPASSVSVQQFASSAYADQAGNTLATVPFIRFQVDFDKIRQGNAVIALREKGGDERIIWSWHIWITDTDLTTVSVATRASTNPVVDHNDMLKVDLGWCDTKVITKFFFTPRKYYVEVTQTQGNAAPVVFEVTQAQDPYYRVFIGAGTFYQYGRKDPFLPMKGTWAYPFNKDSYSPGGYIVTNGMDAVPHIVESGLNDGNVSYGIQNPYIMYHRGGNNGWVAAMHYNLWDVTETTAHSNGALPANNEDKIVVKSIYDPCPPGFSVPNLTAFTIFTKTGGNTGTAAWSNWNNENPWVGGDPRTTDPIETVGLEGGPGLVFYTSDAKESTIYIPFHGFRAGNPSDHGQLGATFFFLLNSKASGNIYSTTFTAGGPQGYHTKSNAYHIRAIKEMQ